MVGEIIVKGVNRWQGSSVQLPEVYRTLSGVPGAAVDQILKLFTHSDKFGDSVTFPLGSSKDRAWFDTET
jgi:hypothetical protein